MEIERKVISVFRRKNYPPVSEPNFASKAQYIISLGMAIEHMRSVLGYQSAGRLMLNSFIQYSNVFISGGKDGIVNPMVNNMAPAYDNAKYDIVWVSTSRIKGENILITESS